MLYSSEISPTRCNNCVFYSPQWLYSTCFGRQSHPSSGVHMLYMATGKPAHLGCKPLRRIKTQLLHLVGLISLLYYFPAESTVLPLRKYEACAQHAAVWFCPFCFLPNYLDKLVLFESSLHSLAMLLYSTGGQINILLSLLGFDYCYPTLPVWCWACSFPSAQQAWGSWSPGNLCGRSLKGPLSTTTADALTHAIQCPFFSFVS